MVKNITCYNLKDYYYIDDDGRVYTKYTGELKELKVGYDKDGYKRASFQTVDGKRISIHIHRLVAITFINNPNDFEIVNHINGIKDDNSVENLEWCTISYNTKHGYTLKDYHYKKILNVYKNDVLVNTFNSLKECALFYNVSYYDISKIANGKIKPYKRGKLANLDFKFS